MKDSTMIKVAAIAGIVILDSLAMIVLHVNGTLMTLAVAAIAGIAGYVLREARYQEVTEKI